jgi:ketosteroid isomerase-like protein
MTATILSSLDVIQQFFQQMERGDYDSAMALIPED